jgi:serine/threonine-protein kinase
VQAARADLLDLCPACLFAAALSIQDELCPYQVLAPIGEDPNGVTYLAQDLTGRRGFVALRILTSCPDADAVRMRHRQWKPILDRIRHPGVGKLLDVGLTEDGALYIASEYVAGWPLTALSSHASMGTGDKLEIARQMTAAVDAAHEAGVVHLKLQSSKVKISTANGLHVTILGFGAALVIDGSNGGPDADRAALARVVLESGLES